ncbi:MAG: GntR family transcriptional regulator [Verrucomicrobiota bacterium]
MTDESSIIPKYFQISRAIVNEIQQGNLAPGSPVLSENEIIAKYQVSNTTARKALLDLEQAGWVERIRGHGTFVKARPVVRNIERIFGFTKNMIEAGRKPSTRLIGFHLREGNHTQIINGREFTMKGPYCEIERVRYADSIPMMKEKRVISLQLCPEIQKKNLEGSLYDIFEKEYGIHLTEINQMLSAVVLEGERLSVFQLSTRTAAFCVEGVSFAGKDLIVEMEDSIYRGDMYKFSAKARVA